MDSQWKFAVIQVTQAGLCNNLRGGVGRKVGGRFKGGGEIGIPMADSC